VVIEPLCGWLLSLGHIFFEEPGEKRIEIIQGEIFRDSEDSASLIHIGVWSIGELCLH